MNATTSTPKLERTRRQFIKTAGATLLTSAAVAAMAGTGSQALAASKSAANDTATSVADITWDEECDVLVVGAGLAGTTAAITAAQNGAKVLLLEKSPWMNGGGNSKYSSGWALFTYNVEGTATYLKNCRGDFDASPDAIYEAFAANLAESDDWVLGLNPPENNMGYSATPEASSDYGEYNEHEGSQWNACICMQPMNKPGTYRHLQFFLMDKIRDDFADLITEKVSAPLTALVQDPQSKAVIGGVYEFEGASVYVKANAGVVMACGGFEADRTMCQDYLSMPVYHTVAAPFNTGDGHRICAKLGADMWHMNSLAGGWTNCVALDGSSHGTYRCLEKQMGITVGINGRRFYMDWDGCTTYDYDFGPGSDASVHVGCRHGHQQFGGEFTHLPMPGVTWFVYDSAAAADEKTPAYHNMSGDPVADGYGYVADTLEELAEQMGVPAEELTTTVAQWNEAVAAGKDPYYFRPDHTLTPIETAPFYAVKCEPELLNTDGGPRRDEHAQILDIDGEPIPGLFSAGEFGSVWCRDYQGGGNLGECLAWGRLAARSALGIEVDPTQFEPTNEVEDAFLAAGGKQGALNQYTDAFKEARAAEREAGAKADAEATYKDGSYEGVAYGMGEEVPVTVVVSGGKISEVTVGDNQETAGIADKAIEQLPPAIVEGNGVNGLDCISGATVTSLAIMNAVEAALTQAK
ncbi:MAG: FAD-binding protein [Coriobacteriia bacterium]|nr:FAD-binding protein [Coriobacteriia bacterium]